MKRLDLHPAGGRRRAPSRTTSIALMALAALGGVVAATMSTGAAGAEAPGSIATVSQLSDPREDRPCAPLRTGLRYQVDDTSESFTLRVVATAAPCAPIVAAAAVYRMPAMGAWPQRLVERTELVIDRAGTTEIRFAKGCEPLQFDVVTGSTPETIAPWGAWHGPLLFVGDVATAKQHRPAGGCGGPATTAVPTTAAPTAEPPSTVPTDVEPTAAGPTSLPPSVPVTVSTQDPDPAAAPSAPADVLGRTQAADPPPALDTAVGAATAPTVAGLALTGTSSRILMIAGACAIALGLAMSVAARRQDRRDSV